MAEDTCNSWPTLREYLSTETTTHMCPGLEERQSFYRDGRFYQVVGFGIDAPIYDEDFDGYLEILNEANYCLFCGARVAPLPADGPLLKGLPRLAL